jgi:hypothetical protein
LPELLNRTTGEYEPVEIASPIDQEDIDRYQTQWLPIINRRIEELRRAGPLTRELLLDRNVEDFHWQWAEKCRERTALEWNSFAVRCAGNTQGLMSVNLLRHCRIREQINQHLVYIDLLSTAPWNRPRLSPQPLYRGTGLVLVTEAILLSREEGFDGRIGLHGLPGATQFYEGQCGMQNLGLDAAYHNLPYLEMTTEQARRLVP